MERLKMERLKIGLNITKVILGNDYVQILKRFINNGP